MEWELRCKSENFNATIKCVDNIWKWEVLKGTGILISGISKSEANAKLLVETNITTLEVLIRKEQS